MTETWISPRKGRRDATREALDEHRPYQGETQPSEDPWALTERSSIEIFVRLPFALPNDARVHGFPLSEAYDASASDYWRNEGPPFVQIQTLTIAAPWAHLVQPGLFEGLHELLGDALPTPRDETLEGPPAPDGAVETWLSIVSPAALIDGEDDLLEGVLERGLVAVNRLIRATKLLTRNTTLTTIALEDLEPIAFWRVQDSKTAGPIALFPLAPKWGLFTALLSDDENRAVDQLVDMQGQHHPFFTYRDWFERARHDREHRGDTFSAVVCLQTAVESLLFNVFYMTHIDAGGSAADLELLRSDSPTFKTLLSRHLQEKLGGSWDTTRGVVGRYWSDLYLLRNRAAHAGHRPSYAEMERAFQASEALTEHVMVRLRANSAKYPRTLFALAGLDGLERRGWMTRRLRETSRALSAEGKPFWWPADVAGREESGQS